MSEPTKPPRPEVPYRSMDELRAAHRAEIDGPSTPKALPVLAGDIMETANLLGRQMLSDWPRQTWMAFNTPEGAVVIVAQGEPATDLKRWVSGRSPLAMYDPEMMGHSLGPISGAN
jgi:hypothetical protein